MHHIAREKTICHKPPLHSFTGERKKKDLSELNSLTSKHVVFLQKYKEKQFCVDKSFDRMCVCNPTVKQRGISV
jgi:hypothetical protein